MLVLQRMDENKDVTVFKMRWQCSIINTVYFNFIPEGVGKNQINTTQESNWVEKIPEVISIKNDQRAV